MLRKLNRAEMFLLVVLFVVTAILRLPGLGYSHFYGDETKTFYLDKTIPAKQFLLDQRKGPTQFLVSWTMEKLSGGYDEFVTRLPFALAGIAAVIILYLIIKDLFNYRAAFIAAILLSVNGFFIAFARTIQYQSILLFFGFLALYLVIRYVRNSRPWLLIAGSASMALACLAHYDAVFFVIPVIYVLVKNNVKLKNFALFCVPVVILLAAFYVPYIVSGYFSTNTLGYIERRVTGSNFDQNFSPYTIFVYNPFIFGLLPLAAAFFVFFKEISWQKSVFLLWFVLAFLTFQFVFLNPGTHIYNYLIPLFVLAGIQLDELAKTAPKFFGNVLLYVLTFVIALQLIYSLQVYLPSFNKGYPWNAPIEKNRHLFLYGFPYYRAWDKVQDYLYAKRGVRNVYTNDNATIAEYYLQKFDVTPPGSNFLPQYYVFIYESQEFRPMDYGFLMNYTLEKEFYHNDAPVAMVFRRVSAD